MEPADLLERKWRELAEEIQRREVELTELQRKFKTLDDARAILVAMTSAAESVALMSALGSQEKTDEKTGSAEPGLQEAVLDYLHHSPADDGLTTSQTAAALRSRYESRYKDRNSYNASIFVTLKRLVALGKVGKIESKDGPSRYLAIESTRSLFNQTSDRTKQESKRPRIGNH